MRAVIGKSEVRGIIAAPPSKSMAHRFLIAAGLSKGESILHNIADSDDIKATIECLRALGAVISEADNQSSGLYKSLRILGADPAESKGCKMYCNESGSTLRFMIPIAALSDNETILRGKSSLMRRPLDVYEELFKSKSIDFKKMDDGIYVKGRLSGGDFKIRGDISSQFVSGLLMALPTADEDSKIILTGAVESKPYIDMTIASLETFGVKVYWAGDNCLEIPGRQKYRAGEFTVEGDWSNAAYLIGLGAEVSGLDDNSLQGDKVCKSCFEHLESENAGEPLDISDCPDLGPVLMAYAAMHKGCLLTGTKRLKIKESDRGAAMKEELSKFGIETEISEDCIRVSSGIKAPTEILYGHNDHRIVMALSALCMKCGGAIDGAEAVNKSYPDFFERIREAGADIKTK